MSEEPTYRTEFKDTGHAVCPETGRDLADFSADGVRAWAEFLFPDEARANFSKEARERKATLLEIAAGKEQ